MKKFVDKVIPDFVKKVYHNKKYNKKVNIYKKVNSKLTDNLKKVSVIIPNYNYANFIIERIDSVLLQTYPIYELIVLDDCSTDNSVSVIEEKLKTIKKVKTKLIVNDKNSHKVFKQWMKGFEEATGDYIWIAEADDSCDAHFLQNVMKPFDDENVVLSFSQSKLIDENNKIIAYDTKSWMYVVSETYWNKSYVHDGDYEIKNALSICNTIPNVSALVWKKGNYNKIFEEATKYEISGDWYIYCKVLEKGKIAFCSKSLNYFRKHTSSASTVAKKETELKELLEIQSNIRSNYKLDSNTILKQSHRYGGLINEVDKNILTQLDDLMVKRIAWIIPWPIKGSGGIKTMIQNANFLVSIGYQVDIYVEEDYVNTSESMKKRIIEYYGSCDCNVFVGIKFDCEYDIMFATYSILTADYVYYSNAKKKAYFIQDYEPWFEPMGGLYLDMEKSYKYGLEGISIGKWLAHKISEEYKAPMHYFNFCADANIYKPLKNIKKENAICFIFQPEKARRCSNIGIRALMLVKKLKPDVDIYLYGSDVDVSFKFDFENLKIIPIKECNELYNKCKVGLCISSSNPSRIPFEMMAAGLPVVDLYRENNLYDIPEDGVLLADSTPEGVATAIIKILDDESLQKKLSSGGIEYMKNYPLESGYNQFEKFVKDLLHNDLNYDDKFKQIYNKSAVMPSKKVKDVDYIIEPNPVRVKNTGKFIRNLVRTKRFLKRTYSRVMRRIFRI